MLDGRTPKNECAVLLEKWSYFVLFCLKIKVKRDISRKVRTRSGFRDRNVPIEEQEGIIFSKGDTV